jgi:RNA polymerase sigma-70 factor, ECF subfamily
MEPSDLALLEHIATGDQDAMYHLYERFHPRLERFLWNRLRGDRALVEDALQEIFLSVWRFAGSFRGQASVATWLFQIAYHQVSRLQRHRNELPIWDQASAEENLEQYEAMTQEAVSLEDAVIDRLMLAHVLRQLSDKHREVLEFVFLYGFTPDEVAAILAVAPGTVKSRISYARRALLRLLKEASAWEVQS